MIKSIITLVFILFIIRPSYSQEQEYIQLRKYTFDNESQLAATENFIESIYIPALKAEGYNRIGIFKNHKEEGDTILNLYLVLPVSSATALYDTEVGMLDKFPDEQHYARVENIFLRSFREMPILKASKLMSPRMDRVYELRSYESATDKKYKNKVEMFNAGGEVVLFEELGFNAVFYGEVIAGSSMPNLMYMTTHENKDAQTKNWKAFSSAPKWEVLKNLPQYQKNVSHIDKYYLYPTEYSDY